ncbi:restriction endonuclease subunit S [Novosphingobium sp. Leaf2]|uniref:restriction endonuclease subunit S n=1 Tax=Novosphingobium sp. Leaf2 TaxID=1735670 RepID=UPI0009E7038F|nr:restriction endonuclease subunit S [Novosphingobium sp. Leaf2]
MVASQQVITPVLPQGWTCQTVGSVIERRPSYGINAAAVPLRGDLPVYLRITDITNQGRLDQSKPVGVNHPNAARYLLAPNDIVFARTGASTGKSYFYDGSDGPLVFAGFLLRVTPDTKRVDPSFLSLAVKTKRFENWLREVSQRSGQPGMNGTQLASFSFFSPPLSEQRAIAAALGDIDGLIAALDTLIAKKRDIKQAAMQQLLTGKTRLPGFARNWKTCLLGDVLRVRHGRDQKAIQRADGRFPILATGGEIGRTDTPLYSKPSVLIGRKGTIDRPQYMDQPFWTVDTLFYTEIKGKNSPYFLFCVFQMIDWRSFNEASGVPSLSSKTIERIAVVMPRPEEQAAIAESLANLDHEVELLQQRLSKFRAIKDGMMQQLLTGRVKLA